MMMQNPRGGNGVSNVDILLRSPSLPVWIRLRSPDFGPGGKRLLVAASDLTLHEKKEFVAMSDSQKTTFDPNELSERLSSLRARFDEFRGRL